MKTVYGCLRLKWQKQAQTVDDRSLCVIDIFKTFFLPKAHVARAHKHHLSTVCFRRIL